MNKWLALILLFPLVLIQAFIGLVGLGLLWIFDRDTFREVWAERPKSKREGEIEHAS